jgi:hypothetical protein
MKRLKYAMPLLMVCAFPFYWKFMASNYSWLTQDVVGQALLAVMTIIAIGFAGCMIVDGLS